MNNSNPIVTAILIKLVWLATGFAYLLSIDDVLSYFVIDGTEFITLVSGVVSTIFICQVNLRVLRGLRGKA